MNENWIERLWAWADENDIPDLHWIDDERYSDNGYWYGMPRNEEKLLGLMGLHLFNSNLNLTELPREIGNLTSLEYFEVGDNSLTELPKQMGHLTSLEYLDLSGNNLAKLPGQMGSLVSLEYLDLGGNNLTELPVQIGYLTSLEYLDLRKNNLTELPGEILNLANLHNLDLRENPNLILTIKQKKWIVDLKDRDCEVLKDDELFGRIFQEEILVSGKDALSDGWMDRLVAWADENDIPDNEWIDFTEKEEIFHAGIMNWEGLPRNRENLWHLINLDLSRSSLAELPKEIGKLPNLTELKLRNNNLTKLPKEIGNLTNLTELSLGSNNFSEFPMEIINLINLKKLDLWAINLTELPKEIGSLINLTELSLEHNRLTKLPKEIENLTSLKKLNLIYNDFAELPGEIGHLINLIELDLSDNNLTKLPKEIMKLTNLTQLILTSNPNLILTQEQEQWIQNLKENACSILIDDNLLSRRSQKEERLKKWTTEIYSLQNDWIARLWKWADDNDIPDYNMGDAYRRCSSYEGNESYMPGWGWRTDNTTFKDSGYVRGFPRDRKYLLSISGLDLRRSGFTELPKEIGNLTNLTGLCLDSCNLTKLPKEIGNLVNLTGLYLERNSLIRLPEEVGSLTNLTSLVLNENNLTELPKEIVNLINLTELNLKENPNLILTQEQEPWIKDLEENGCNILMDEDSF